MSRVYGCVLAVAAGVTQGAFPLPMKFMPDWKWENIWFAFSLWGFVVLPWILAFATVPDLAGVYAATSWKTLAVTVCCGLAWGIGTLCFGLGVRMVGMALGFALMNGMTGAFGTLFPMLARQPEAFGTPAGRTILAGVVLLLVGVALCALAGHRRGRSDMRSGQAGAKDTARNNVFALGLLVCVICGLTSPMLNFAFVFGQEIVRSAEAAGAAPAHASNPVWCLTMSAAFITTLAACLAKMVRDRGWRRFAGHNAARCWALSGVMGALWAGGIALYGAGLSRLGTLSASVGWPLLMIATVMTGVFCGMATGEWKGVALRPRLTLLTGLVTLAAAAAVIGIGNAR
ncbi:MAG: L-rhamnose/proton symporter RhaT [Kiritimatiellae bacterium]|nr:L-rhamnose/proton symporter RhaT [Kiritimatiellia bacterium]